MSTLAPDNLAEGDLVEAIFPGGSWRPAKVKEIGDTYIAICFTGNPTRHELPPHKVRPRPGLRPKRSSESAAEVIDLTIDVDEDEKIKAQVLHDVDSLANAVKLNIPILSRPSFFQAFGASASDLPRHPTPPQPLSPLHQHRDPYAEHPIVRPLPGSILDNTYPGDYPDRSHETEEYPLARGRPWYRGERNLGFQNRESHFEAQYRNFSGRKEQQFSDLRASRNPFSRSYDDRGPPPRAYLRPNSRNERSYVANDDEEGYEAEDDDQILLPPSPTERVRLEQEHIGIHPDLSSMRIPRVSDRRGGTRARLPYDEDDAIFNRHPDTWRPSTWRQSHMTVAGSSPAEKFARREAAKKRTSPRAAWKKPPPASSRSETVSEVTEDDTLSSSDEVGLENLSLLEIQKKNKRPVDLPPGANSKRPKVHHLSSMKGDVIASGVRPTSLKANNGKIIAGRKKPRVQPLVEVVDLVSGSASGKAERSKQKRRAPWSTPILPDIPPVVPRRGIGRRKSKPRRDAGFSAIAIAHEIDKCVEKDFRAYDEMLKSCSLSSSIFDDYNVTEHSPSSARFLSCTCDPKSQVDKAGKILRCTLCARYSHLWCTGLGRKDLDQLNVEASTRKAQFVCMQCTEMVADGKPPPGKPFPSSTDLNKRLIIPSIVFPLFEFLLTRSIPSARLLLNLRNNPRSKQQYWQLSEEDKRKMRQNVELLRTGVLPRSVRQSSVTRLLTLR